MWIEVVNGGLQPSSKVTKKMRDCFEQASNEKGWCFNGVDEDSRKVYWNEFQKYCCWDQAVEKLVEIVFYKKMPSTYRSYMYGIRKLKKRPNWVAERVWTEWQRVWSTTEFKDKSRKGRKNRCSGGERPRASHSGGAISSFEHRDRLARALGVDETRISLGDVYVYTHTRDHDGQSFLDERARSVNDRIEQITQRLQQAGEEIINTSQVYYEAVGGRDNRQRIYGLGYGAGFYPSQRGEASSSSQIGGSSSTAPAQPSLHQLYEHILQLQSTMQQILADREHDRQSGLQAIDVDQRLMEHSAMIQGINAQITSLQRDLSRANGTSSSRSSNFPPHAPSS